MKHYNVFALLLLLVSLASYGQDKKLDSLIKAGNTNLYNGNYDEAYSDFNERKIRSEELKDSVALAESLTYLGEVCRASRLFDLGLSFLSQALTVSEQIGDSFYIAKALNRMSAIKFEQRDTTSSLQFAKQSLGIFQRLHEANLSANSLNIMGAVFTSAGQYSKAIEYHNQARKILLTLSDQSDLPNVLNNIANNYLLLGQFQRVLPYAEESFLLASKDSTLIYKLQASILLTSAYKALGNFEQALYYSEKAAAINEQYVTELKTVKQSVIKLENKNELAAKENADLRQLNESKARLLKVQTDFISIVIGGLILMSGLLLLLLVLYRQRKKNLQILRQQNVLVENQKKELQKLNELKDTLLTVISHDFRGPLVTLHSMMQLLDMGLQSKDELSEITERVRKHLYKTIENLDSVIFWSRTQMLGFNLNKEKFDLKEFSNEVVRSFEPEMQAKNLIFENRIQESDVIVSDPNLLKIILRNLLSNAIKFSHTNGSIVLFEKKEKNHVRISLQDSGIGIHPEIKEKLLSNEHITTRGTKNEKGTGMGLILTRDLITKLGGTIQIQSEVDQGSTFTISIPE